MGGEGCRGFGNLIRRQRERGLDLSGGQQGLLDGFDAAEAAADRAGHGAAAGSQRSLMVAGQLDLEIDAAAGFFRSDGEDVFGLRNDSFVEREAVGEVFQVAGLAIITAWVEPR